MGASGQVVTDACEDLAVKEVAKLVEGSGLLRPCSGNAAARREEGDRRGFELGISVSAIVMP